MCYDKRVKIGVSLSDELLAFADDEAARRGLTRSGLLAAFFLMMGNQTAVLDDMFNLTVQFEIGTGFLHGIDKFQKSQHCVGSSGGP